VEVSTHEISFEDWQKLPVGTYAQITHSGGEEYHVINGGGNGGASSSGFQICTAGQWEFTWRYAETIKILYTPKEQS
jgi:uncharacterized cupin superfamily protein